MHDSQIEAITAGHHGEGGIDGTHWLVKMYTSCWSRAAASRWTWAIHCLSGTQLSEKCRPPFSPFLTPLTSLSKEGGFFFFFFSVSAQGFQEARWRCAPECIYGCLTSHQSSKAHSDLLFPFVWEEENDFQCDILKCWDLRIWKEHCEKVKDTVK